MIYSYEFTELVRQVCNDSKAAGVYIGKDFKIETNYKLRSIRDMFVNNIQHPDVMIVNIHPLQLAWAPTYIWNPNKTKDKNETSGASGASGASADYSKKGREQSSSHTDVAEATDATEVDKNTEADEYEKYKARTLERFDRELNNDDD